MKLFRLLLVALLFSCSDDSKEAPETGDPKPIFVEMVDENRPDDVTNVAGTYILEKNKEYAVREDGKYKILLTKRKYKDNEEKIQEVLAYGIFDVANNKYLYHTEKIDVAKRLEEYWEYYTYNSENTVKKLVCKSYIKEEEEEK